MATSPFDGIDLTDPCAVWPILEKASLELLAGKRVAKVSFGHDEVAFSNANYAELQRKISELKAECAAKTLGGRRRRRAITAGFR